MSVSETSHKGFQVSAHSMRGLGLLAFPVSVDLRDRFESVRTSALWLGRF